VKHLYEEESGEYRGFSKPVSCFLAKIALSDELCSKELYI